MKDGQFAAIVLSAGLSTRMKDFKPLLPIAGTTIIERAITTFDGMGIDIYVIVGYRRQEVIQAVNHLNVTCVYNPLYREGMFSSVISGIQNLKPTHQAFFILPADIPMVKQATVKKILYAATTNPGHILYPVFEGKRGHPPLIPSSLVPEILAWNKGGGLKAVLRCHGEQSLEIPVDDEYILRDVDTPEEYSKLAQ